MFQSLSEQEGIFFYQANFKQPKPKKFQSLSEQEGIFFYRLCYFVGKQVSIPIRTGRDFFIKGSKQWKKQKKVSIPIRTGRDFF